MDPEGSAVPCSEFIGLARDEGLSGLDVLVVQTPTAQNGRSAVVQVTARCPQGGYSAVGEASPESAPPDWHPFLTTLAELRAKARALRDLTGLDHAVAEELDAPYLRHHDERMSPERPGPPTPGPGAMRPPKPGGAEPSARGAGTPGAASGHNGPTPNGTPLDDSRVPDSKAAGVDAGDAAGPDAGEAAGGSEMESAHAAGYDGVGADMEAKLIKLAMSIASLENEDISEAEARQKLDDFFKRVFKHPLDRASKLEGQRVVQRLSSDLYRLRAQSTS